MQVGVIKCKGVHLISSGIGAEKVEEMSRKNYKNYGSVGFGLVRIGSVRFGWVRIPHGFERC